MRPSFANNYPRKEGAGNAGCAMHPQSRVQKLESTRGRHHRFTGATGIPRAMVLTRYFVISPVIGLCCHRHLANMAGPRPVGPTSPPRNLTPASRRQDHTTSPSASAPFVCALVIAHGLDPALRSRLRADAAASTASLPNVRDGRETPLSWAGTAQTSPVICPEREGKYFLNRGWTWRQVICPSGRIGERNTH